MDFDLKNFQIPKDLIERSSSRSGGAGGQHVNKVSTKIEIRFHLMEARWIPLAVRRRIALAYPGRMNKAGELVISSDQSRSQYQNEEMCFEKLYDMIASCWTAPKKRIKTRPTRSSKEKRIGDKKRLSEKKKNRKV